MLNTPYPGGYPVAPRPPLRAYPCDPDRDRSAPLSRRQPDRAWQGLAGTAALLRRMIDAATDELLTGGLALAAERGGWDIDRPRLAANDPIADIHLALGGRHFSLTPVLPKDVRKLPRALSRHPNPGDVFL